MYRGAFEVWKYFYVLKVTGPFASEGVLKNRSAFSEVMSKDIVALYFNGQYLSLCCNVL